MQTLFKNTFLLVILICVSLFAIYFVSENASNIRRIIPLSTHTEDEISSLLDEIVKKHENKDEKTLEKQKNEFVEVFKDWVSSSEEEIK